MLVAVGLVVGGPIIMLSKMTFCRILIVAHAETEEGSQASKSSSSSAAFQEHDDMGDRRRY